MKPGDLDDVVMTEDLSRIWVRRAAEPKRGRATMRALRIATDGFPKDVDWRQVRTRVVWMTPHDPGRCEVCRDNATDDNNIGGGAEEGWWHECKPGDVEAEMWWRIEI